MFRKHQEMSKPKFDVSHLYPFYLSCEKLFCCCKDNIFDNNTSENDSFSDDNIAFFLKN